MTELDSQGEGQSSAATDLTQRTAWGAAWSGLATAGRQLLSLVSLSILARKLGPGSYGVMGIAGTITVFLTNFRDLGTTTAIIRRLEVSQSLLSTLFWTNAALGVVVAAALVLAARTMAIFFHEPQLNSVLPPLAISSMAVSLGLVHNALLSRRMRFREAGLSELISSIAGYAAAITFAFLDYGVWSLVFANIAMTAAMTLSYWAFARWKPSFHFSLSELREVAGFSLNFAGFGFVNYFARNADNIVVGRYLGALSLGYYQMAYNLMLYPMQNLTGLVAQVTLPALSKIQEDNRRFADAYIRTNCLIALVTFPVFAGMGAVAGPMARTILGPKWIPVVPIFQILAPVGLIQSVWTMVGQIYVAKGRADWMLRMGVVSTIVYVLGFRAGVSFGPAGVAAGYAITFALMIVPMYLIPFRLIDLRFGVYLRYLWPQLAITAIMTGCCVAWLWWLNSRGASAWSQLISGVAVGAVIYIGLLLRWAPPGLAILEETVGRLNPGIGARFSAILRKLGVAYGIDAQGVKA